MPVQDKCLTAYSVPRTFALYIIKHLYNSSMNKTQVTEKSELDKLYIFIRFVC